MGANSSRESAGSTASGATTPQKYSDLVDLGSLLPCGLYPNATQDYDYRSIRKLIIDRRIAPFYKGQNDVPDIEEQVPQQQPPATNGVVESLSVPVAVPQASSSTSTATTKKSPDIGRPRSASSSSVNSAGRPTGQSLAVDSAKERQRALIERMKAREKILYNDAIECPICFLYYPSNINHSRCCDQPICTECFIQIKRPPETPATPASCPFCVEENFGVIYKPPQWSQIFERHHLLKDGEAAKAVPIRNGATHTTSGKGTNTNKPRRQSVSHKDPEVVLVDHIRPDWNRMLDVSRAAPGSRRNSATQANSSRTRGVGGAIGSIMTRPGRSASSAASNEYYVSAAMRRMNLQNMDLEDLMVMEAVRLSLLEEEERRRTQRQQQQDQPAASTTADNAEQNRRRAGNESELILENVNEEEDDDDEPLFHSVVNGMRERQNVSDEQGSETVSNTQLASSPVEICDTPLQEPPASGFGSHADVAEVPVFDSTSNGRSTDSRDHKPLMVVEGEDRSRLDSVSSV
ncbi:hypothetical protein BGW37DRAFT_228798 [Umbelopsis sp. PMI_123]|nr:hypothetical protein BGW37DRAFT_228798 [Umbelopsis sp. PMI_123]